MTDPLLAHATEYGRMYARSTSEAFAVPSITTVIGQQAHSLDGWFGYMGANSLANDPELPRLLGSPAGLRQAVSKAAKAAEVYRDDAAQRGDRVHGYCEQVALRALGRPHQVKEARELLAANGEEAFAARFDEWWELYRVEPLAPEITVWNTSVGYAGTLDLVARINGRICLIDYKTKGTNRDGTVKALAHSADQIGEIVDRTQYGAYALRELLAETGQTDLPATAFHQRSADQRLEFADLHG